MTGPERQEMEIQKVTVEIQMQKRVEGVTQADPALNDDGMLSHACVRACVLERRGEL